jgi:hypothetical protein
MKDLARALEDAERRATGQAPPEETNPVDALTEVARLAQLGALKYEVQRRDAPVALSLPRMTSAADTLTAMATVLEAMARGDLTPGEATVVVALVEQYRKTLELTEFEARIAALEASHAKAR